MSKEIMNKYALDTPCLIIDIDLLEDNLKLMQSSLTKAGKNLCSHAKTHKCSTLAHKQLQTGAIGICAAKITEAEVLVKAGVKGVLITGPLATSSKIQRYADILGIDPTVKVVVDNKTAIDMLAEILAAKGLQADILLDIDVGQRRTGISPSDANEFIEYILTKKNLKLCGIQSYAGNIQHVKSFEERKSLSHSRLKNAVDVFNLMKTKTENCKIFSASGTGTSEIDILIPELTELQAGSYAVMDVEYMSIGSADNPEAFSKYKPAMKLLTSVVSVNQKDFVTIDAGLKALYSDAAIPKVYTPEYKNLAFDWSGDEYGKLIRPENSNLKLPPIGTVIEMIVSHCDPTINLFDKYYITKGDEVIDTWKIDLRGCCV